MEAEARRAGGQDEEWLVRKIRKGDRSSFETLYRRHSGRVHALLLRLCRSTAEAEELTQEVFVRAWENRGTFRSPEHFPLWLNRVAVNLIHSGRRRKARRGDLPLLEDDPAPPPSRLRPSAGMRADLEKAIATLPEGARTVLVLHDIHGYTHAEITAITGSAVGTNKAQLHRARQRLRKHLRS